MKYILILIISFFISANVAAQYEDDDEEFYDYGTYYGVKGGIGLNNQLWDRQINTDLLFTPFIDFIAESYDASSWSSLYAQIGFHQRGSSLGGFGIQRFATYRFNNVVAEIGGKRIALDKENWDGYYTLGIRAEYTIKTNLSNNTTSSAFNIIDESFVNNFNYGLSVGGGFEKQLEDHKVIFFELKFSPDLSAQYDQPFVIGPLANPFTTTGQIFIDPQKVRNYSLELTVGYKWLR